MYTEKFWNEEISKLNIVPSNAKQHECEIIKKSENISVQTLDFSKGWFFVIWKEFDAYQILYCPFCGTKLEV